MSSSLRNKVDTASQILDVAERLVQVRGFNAFSYADVAAELHITTAALHYHFAGKAELGEALITRYTTRFIEALTAIEAKIGDAAGRLDAYADLYVEVFRQNRMCLCGMVAADFETLPASMRSAVVSFFDQKNEAWLSRILQRGLDDTSLQFVGSSVAVARTLVSGLEGAMLLARPFGDTGRFQEVVEHLLTGLRSPMPTSSRIPSSQESSKRPRAVALSVTSSPRRGAGRSITRRSDRSS